MMRPPFLAIALGLVLVLGSISCGHTDAFSTGVDRETTPFGSQVPVRLTQNPADNYWPSWTEDGRGILYRYSQQNLASDDRCIGLLPPTGGARLWELCDTRLEHADSADSFGAVALGTDGRLLYLEASARRGSGGASGVNPLPQSIALWLADTARPFTRRALVTFPRQVGSTFVNWLHDAQWTGPTTFVALAQTLTPRSNCVACAFVDSVFTGIFVVKGEITASGATLTPITGTEGAQYYSLADNQGTIVFLLTGNPSLLRVPVAGGSATQVGTLPFNGTPTGLTCSGNSCVVSTGRPGNPASVYRVTVGSGEVVGLSTSITDSPHFSPTSTDLVGRWVVGSTKPLYLYQGVVP